MTCYEITIVQSQAKVFVSHRSKVQFVKSTQLKLLKQTLVFRAANGSFDPMLLENSSLIGA